MIKHDAAGNYGSWRGNPPILPRTRMVARERCDRSIGAFNRAVVSCAVSTFEHIMLAAFVLGTIITLGN